MVTHTKSVLRRGFYLQCQRPEKSEDQLISRSAEVRSYGRVSRHSVQSAIRDILGWSAGPIHGP